MEEGAPRGKVRHVRDLATWIEGFTIFTHTLLQIAPHWSAELLSYQSLIIEASRRFTPEGWLDYDSQFRQAVANVPSMRWDSIDANIWQLTTSGKARHSCGHCGTTHQPFPSGRWLFHQSRTQSTGTFTGSSAPIFNGRPICCNFQHNRCSGNCGRAHVCLNCQGPHPSQRCNEKSGSAARPSSKSKTQ